MHHPYLSLVLFISYDLFHYLCEITFIVTCSVRILAFLADATVFDNELECIVHEATIATFIHLPITVNQFLL